MSVGAVHAGIPQDVEGESVQQRDIQSHPQVAVMGVPTDVVDQPMSGTHISTLPGGFSYGLCSCCQDMGVCCDVFWCSPCSLACAYDAIIKKKPNSMNVGVCLFTSVSGLAGYAVGAYLWYGLGIPLHGIAYTLGCIPYTYTTCQLRGALRPHLGMRDECGEDCVFTWFCLSCVQCQVTREAERLGMRPGRICPREAPQPVGDTDSQELVQSQPIQPAYVRTVAN